MKEVEEALEHLKSRLTIRAYAEAKEYLQRLCVPEHEITLTKVGDSYEANFRPCIRATSIPICFKGEKIGYVIWGVL